ncbi:hypothetical protein Pmani_025937 [Petrolisthes manimaculis]|uniref:Small ribosomal subunit protein mS31 n=1 Tax=Petrolisthes manimaculis TaxID=1843537 RepID=A0AAE1P6Y1_9EUCA|nr:hypothetical protein Pmani_025937 [Petrolisthes manimaculis]
MATTRLSGSSLPVLQRLFSRNGILPIFQRTFCKVPPEDPTQAEEAKTIEQEKLGDSNSTADTPVKESGVKEQIEAQDPKVLSDKQVDNVSPDSSDTSKAEAVQETKKPVPSQEKKLTKKEETQKKLRDLLASLATVDPLSVESTVKLTRPKPRPKKEAKVKKEEDLPPPESYIEPELVSATKEVAESLGGDAAATESELLSTLRLHSSDAPPHTQAAASLSELFVGMKIERSPNQGETAPIQHKHISPEADPRRQPDANTRRRKLSRLSPERPIPKTIQRVDLFGAKPLGIFTSKCSKSENVSSILPVWEALHEEELKRSMSHPPDNAFVEMMTWTNQGKLWTFPIDNEFGLESEKKIGFHEHVFLERHLQGWCPPLGPIRHFMELVCTGLSKNPYITVERKRAHIEWYRNYFAEKEGLLKEIGAIQSSN